MLKNNKYNNFIKFKKVDSDYYTKESNGKDFKIENLCIFLVSELRTFVKAKEWKKIILDNNCKSNAGNRIFMVKNNENVSIITQFNEIDLDEDWFTTTKNDIIRIIDKWFDLIKKQPAEIIIFEDESGKIMMEGHSKPTPSWIKKKEKSFPRFFVIKTTTRPASDEEISLEHSIINVLKNRLGKEIGEVWFESIAIFPGIMFAGQDDYIFGIRYNPKKTIQDIANQFTEFTWKKNDEKLVWKKNETNRVFFDKKIKSAEIYIYK